MIPLTSALSAMSAAPFKVLVGRSGNRLRSGRCGNTLTLADDGGDGLNVLFSLSYNAKTTPLASALPRV